MLRRDAGDQAGLRIGQVVGRRLAIQHDRLADLVEFGIGADRRRTATGGRGADAAEGFVVVPEKGGGGHEAFTEGRGKKKAEWQAGGIAIS